MQYLRSTYTKTFVCRNSTLFVYTVTLVLEMTFHVEIDASEIFWGNPGAYCSICMCVCAWVYVRKMEFRLVFVCDKGLRN